MTPEEIIKHAKRIAVERAYSAIESFAEDGLFEAIRNDEEIPSSATVANVDDIHVLAYDYMMDLRVSL